MPTPATMTGCIAIYTSELSLDKSTIKAEILYQSQHFENGAADAAAGGCDTSPPNWVPVCKRGACPVSQR